MMSIFSADRSSASKIELLGQAENLLPPCPSSPNCVRRTYRITANAEKIYPLVLKTLNNMNVLEIQENRDNFSIQAVFKIFMYKDDVSVQLESHDLHTLLHIRSASREGYYDFGVNQRRVRRFIKKLSQKI